MAAREDEEDYPSHISNDTNQFIISCRIRIWRIMKESLHSVIAILVFVFTFYNHPQIQTPTAFVLFTAFYQLVVLSISSVSATTVVYALAGVETGHKISVHFTPLSILKTTRRQLITTFALTLVLMSCSFDVERNSGNWVLEIYLGALCYPNRSLYDAWSLLGWMIYRCGLLYVSCSWSMAHAVSATENADETMKEEEEERREVQLRERRRNGLFWYTVLFIVGYGTNGIMFGKLVGDTFGFGTRFGYGDLMAAIVGYLAVSVVVVCKLVGFLSSAVGLDFLNRCSNRE